jgi:hypothetical protein
MRIIEPQRKKYFQDYWKKNKNLIYKNRKNYHLVKRKFLLKMLGNKCAFCGFSDTRALQIDHINGGGCREIKGLGGMGNYKNELFKLAKLDKKKFFSKYQLLCANCNWIKIDTNNERKKGNCL